MADNETSDKLRAVVWGALYPKVPMYQPEDKTGEIQSMYRKTDVIVDALLALPVEERAELVGFQRIDWYAHYVPTLPYEIDRWRRVHDKNSVHMDGCYPLYVEKLSDEMRETLETYARRET